MGNKKKEEKRKELEEYVKVMSNILKLDKKTKETLISAIQKWTLTQIFSVRY